ncbi:MAG: adenylosuccinate lyase [Clostridiales bacterium]|nr:adenylosuccinate lyase [Clostridiales bacterium]
MQGQETYQSPFTTRYGSPEMQSLFSPAHRARLMRRMWLVLAQTQQELGLPITDAQVAELAAHTEDVDFEAISRFEQELRHDVMAHLKAYALACPAAAPIIHLGATSCYVTDNADVLILQDAMRLLRRRIVGTARALSKQALQYKSLPMLGYTHFQPAQPTTLGKRITLWLQDLLMDLAEVNHFLSSLRPLGCKGATGTQASFLALYEGDADKVRQLDARIAQRMGFDRPLAVSGQTYTRKMDSRALQVLSGIAQSAHKFSNDMRLLQHLKEVEEPFETAQVGSSAMPYKRNPMRSERVAALCRFIINNAANAEQTAAAQWLERTLDDSANRRLSQAEGFLAADAVLTLYENIASGLVAYPQMMDQHLRLELPFMATENILMQAVMKGGNRQELHERIRSHAMAAGKRVKEEGLPNDLLARIAGDPAFGLSAEDLQALLNPADYIGLAIAQTEDYVLGEAADILNQHADEEGLSPVIKL